MKTQNNKTISLAILVMALWGSLFTFVKLGYKVFGMDTDFVPNLLFFAGLRFLICGGIILIYCAKKGKNLKITKFNQWGRILSVGLFAVILHYSFTYVGLTMTDSSKTALLKQLGVLFFICFSFLFFNDDKFSIGKLLGAIFGLCGIIVLNTQSLKISFTIGEIMIIGASVCTVISNISCKRLTKEVDAIVVTGYSQFIGGLVLTIVGFTFCGSLGTLSVKGLGIMAYICVASIFGYCIWYSLVGKSELSKLFIIKFSEPLFAALCGAVLLKENIFNIQYLLALIFVVLAIFCSEHSFKFKK